MARLPPGNIGRRLLPSLVDEIAEFEPHRVVFSIAKTKDPADGFQDISAKAFANAVDRCAWHIENSLGPAKDFPTLVYIGPQDLVYVTLLFACIKTGYKIMFVSPRNSLEAHLSLLERTDCDTFLLPPNFALPVVKDILAARQMRVLDVPGVGHWIENDGDDKPYPYNKTFEEAKYDPIAVLHSSGSTGTPKPITQTHRSFASMDAYNAIPSFGFPGVFPTTCKRERLYLSFPLFHLAGLILCAAGTFFCEYTTVLGPFPPSADIVDSVIIHGNVQHASLAPITLVDLVKHPEYLENLNRLDILSFGGGPLPQQIGDLLTAKTKCRLINSMGATETSLLPMQFNDPEDWIYMSLCPIMKHEYRHVSGDLYEQVLIRDSELDIYQGVFGTFPELHEYHMKDLYIRHPTKENLWMYKGRADDVIVFSNGEKLQPVDMEGIITSHTAVNGALVAGQSQFQACLLVEAVNPLKTGAQKEKLLEDIWPSVQAANKQAPSHGRIHREMIIFTSPEKPMHRAGKGTVQRKFTTDLYAAEIDALYKETSTVDTSSSKPNGGSADLAWNGLFATEIVEKVVDSYTDIDRAKITAHTDLFDVGLDSLQVTIIAKKLSEVLSHRGIKTVVQPKTIYDHHSLASLISVVNRFLQGEDPVLANGVSGKQQIQDIFQLHAEEIQISERKPLTKPAGDLCVLLTGSTGSVGSYVLGSLVRDSHVSRIYCVNRGPHSIERQKKSQASKRLAPPPDKVEFLETDMSKPYLGLPRDTYRKLLSQVTTIIHNAWKVNFNQAVESFSTNILSVRRLIDFSTQSTFGATVYFISSIGTVTNKCGAVPEKIFEEWDTPQGIGYAQSKFIGEKLLQTAAKEAGVPAVICRVGQVAGPTTEAGQWPKQEWLPSLIGSSKYLGKLPRSLGMFNRVDWIPVDFLGQVIVELATSPGADTPPVSEVVVHHVVNPHSVSWDALAAAVSNLLSAAENVELVSLEEWVASLRGTATKTEDIERNPAVKLLDFFETFLESLDDPPFLDTQEATKLSPTMAKLNPVNEIWMGNWIGQWQMKDK